MITLYPGPYLDMIEDEFIEYIDDEIFDENDPKILQKSYEKHFFPLFKERLTKKFIVNMIKWELIEENGPTEVYYNFWNNINYETINWSTLEKDMNFVENVINNKKDTWEVISPIFNEENFGKNSERYFEIMIPFIINVLNKSKKLNSSIFMDFFSDCKKNKKWGILIPSNVIEDDESFMGIQLLPKSILYSLNN